MTIRYKYRWYSATSVRRKHIFSVFFQTQPRRTVHDESKQTYTHYDNNDHSMEPKNNNAGV